jgi:hypothetical protein
MEQDGYGNGQMANWGEEGRLGFVNFRFCKVAGFPKIGKVKVHPIQPIQPIQSIPCDPLEVSPIPVPGPHSY